MLLKRWIPVVSLAVTLFATVTVWQALVRSEQAALSHHVGATASAAKVYLAEELEKHAKALSRHGKRLEILSSVPAWRKDVKDLVESEPAFMGIMLTGPSFDIRVSEPADIASVVMRNEQVAKVFENARSKGGLAISRLFDVGGSKGFVMAMPLKDRAGFSGVVAGFMDSREMIDEVLADSVHEISGYGISFSLGGDEFYRDAAVPFTGWSHDIYIEGAGIDWKITAWPGPEKIAEHISVLPQTVFALGSVSSVLLSFLVYLGQTNKLRAKDLERANEMLKAEVRQRAATEEELRESDEKFRSLVETTNDWIWEVDAALRYTYVSPRVKDILGYSPEEVLGKSPWDFMPNAEADRVKAEFVPIFEKREPFGLLSNTNIRKDGVRVVLETSGAPVFDKGGVFIGYRGVDRNVTLRKEAEDALKKINERLENAQRIARLGSWEWDIEKDDLDWSDEIYRIFGVEAREFGATYEAFLGFVHPEDRMAVHRGVTEALTLRKPYSIEHRIVLADGTQKIVHEQGEVKFNSAGNPVSMSGTVQDITERKQMDEQLRLYREHLRELVEERTSELNDLNERLKFEVEIRKKAEGAVIRMNEDLERRAVELERVNKELEAFTYSASHDLQEPLRVISGYVQLLGRRYKGRLDDEADEFITYAVDGVARMQRLITDLLSYSRLGRLSALSPVDFEAALSRVKANLRLAIEESGALVRNSPLPTVLADQSQMDQLLMNLLNNAIKYRGKDAPLITVSAVREAGEWVFAVTDNGIGIDPKYAERVFDIFQRLHRSAEYPGTGIGLSICKKVVENHGGRIWVESLPGAGSTFYFTIPDKESFDA